MIQTKKRGIRLEWIVPEKWQNYSLESLFKQHWKAPKKQVHELRMTKSALINNIPADWTGSLQKGDILSIPIFTSKEENHPVATYIDIDVLHEDDHLLVVNKPAGMDTHPNTAEQKDTLLNAVAFYLQAKGEMTQVRHIHRLDRDTTGAILFAKHPLIGAILDARLEDRHIKRTYLALVHGELTRKKGRIDQPIGRDRHHPTRRRVSPTGQKAITNFETLSYHPSKKLSLVQCQLETGRTHQIRVHFSSIGHPLAGDTLYGGKALFKRQALHAAKLEFVHPYTEEIVSCYAPFKDAPPIFPNIKIADLL